MEVKATQKQVRYLRYLNKVFVDRVKRHVFVKYSHRSHVELEIAKSKLSVIEGFDFGGLSKREASRMIDAYKRLLRMPPHAMVDYVINLSLDELFSN